jgi:drug/metabolite transporter (DMT)-like permease
MWGVVSLGLAAAVIFGASDFLGGFAARGLPALRVTLIAFLAGLITALACLPFVASAWTTPALIYGAVAGVAAAASIWLLYACLAMGPVSVLAPLVALIAALVPVAYGLAHHERLGTPGKIALGAILVAAVMVGYTPADHGVRAQPRALLLGVAAGLATGAYLVALDYTPPRSGAAPVVMVYAAGALLLALVALVALLAGATRRWRSPALRPKAEAAASSRRAWSWPWPAPLRFAVISGVTQAVADVLVVIGIHRGYLAVMAVLMALYPLGTIALARVITRESPTSVQLAGIFLAVAASAVLSAT